MKKILIKMKKYDKTIIKMTNKNLMYLRSGINTVQRKQDN